MARLRSFSLLPVAALLCATLATEGCKKAAPVQNADGTVSNPNGSVTVPNQAAPQAIAVRNPDGSITNPDGSVTYPAGSKVAQRENSPNGTTPAVTTPEPAPVAASRAPAPVPAAIPPAAPAPVRRSVPAGTPITIRTNGSLAASKNEVGDRWTGSLERPVVSGGSTIFASGTPVAGTVVASKGKGRFKGEGALGIELTTIGRDTVQTSEYEQIAKGRGKRTAGFIGGGAGLGAIIGGIAGGGKGALIGGLSGAGAGTAATAFTGSRDVIIPAESVITFRLRSSLTR